MPSRVARVWLKPPPNPPYCPRLLDREAGVVLSLQAVSSGAALFDAISIYFARHVIV